jgi:DNA-binding transcriptional LysR family regulator
MLHTPCANLHGVVDWNDLRYFLAVAKTGTLVAAGRELRVEHTTVSRRLAALESALGTRLFTRGPDGLTLTHAGAEVLPHAQAVLQNMEAIARAVQGGDGKVEGLVRLTVPESIDAYMIQELAELRARHPGLILELLSENRELDLRRGEADLALRFRDVSDRELVVKKLGPAGWSVYAAPAYLQRKGRPQSIEDLSGHDVIGFDASLSAVVGAAWLQKDARGGNVVLRGNSLTAVQSAATFGFGIAPLPCMTADRDPALVRLTPEAIGMREIFLVVHPDLTRVARVRATMEFLCELFVRDAPLWRGQSAGSAPSGSAALGGG